MTLPTIRESLASIASSLADLSGRITIDQPPTTIRTEALSKNRTRVQIIYDALPPGDHLYCRTNSRRKISSVLADTFPSGDHWKDMNPREFVEMMSHGCNQYGRKSQRDAEKYWVANKGKL